MGDMLWSIVLNIIVGGWGRMPLDVVIVQQVADLTAPEKSQELTPVLHSNFAMQLGMRLPTQKEASSDFTPRSAIKNCNRCCAGFSVS